MPDFSSDDVLAIVPLRAGSKGLPGKNLRPLAGKPLYRHTVDQALRVVGRCVISTDIPEVLRTSLPKGCTALARPPALAMDETPMAPVLQHVFEQLSADTQLPKTAVLLQATSPLRRDQDILKALDLYTSNSFELVMSVTKTDPSILKYGTVSDGRFTAVSDPEYCFFNRQSLPSVVRPNGAIYVFSPETFMRTGTLATPSIGAIEMPTASSVDIDTLADLNAAESAMMHASIPLAS